jgi:hypothetical protein
MIDVNQAAFGLSIWNSCVTQVYDMMGKQKKMNDRKQGDLVSTVIVAVKLSWYAIPLVTTLSAKTSLSRFGAKLSH